jgi:hypothetical protein
MAVGIWLFLNFVAFVWIGSMLLLTDVNFHVFVFPAISDQLELLNVPKFWRIVLMTLIGIVFAPALLVWYLTLLCFMLYALIAIVWPDYREEKKRK